MDIRFFIEVGLGLRLARLAMPKNRPTAAALSAKYGGQLRKGVALTLGAEPSDALYDLMTRMQSNVSRFGAYKGYYVEKALSRVESDDRIPADKKQLALDGILATAAARQATEYNTTVRRARTAKQFAMFNEAERRELFPNLRWLPSRSAAIREEHAVFYNRVWSKDDSFWSTNYPGNLWNCKCDIEETDYPVTQGNDAVKEVRPSAGLGTNPAGGVVFDGRAAYFSNDRAAKSFYLREERLRLYEAHSSPAGKTAVSNLQTGYLNDTKRAFKNLLHHSFSEDEMAVAAVLPHRLNKLTNPKYETLGTGKDAVKDAKNIAKKERRGVVGYNKYLFEFMGKQYRVVMEVHAEGFEQYYALSPVR